jgi:hypothetical protein
VRKVSIAWGLLQLWPEVPTPHDSGEAQVFDGYNSARKCAACVLITSLQHRDPLTKA